MEAGRAAGLGVKGIGTDEVMFVPTVSEEDQLTRLVDLIRDFGYYKQATLLHTGSRSYDPHNPM